MFFSQTDSPGKHRTKNRVSAPLWLPVVVLCNQCPRKSLRLVDTEIAFPSSESCMSSMHKAMLFVLCVRVRDLAKRWRSRADNVFPILSCLITVTCTHFRFVYELTKLCQEYYYRLKKISYKDKILSYAAVCASSKNRKCTHLAFFALGCCFLSRTLNIRCVNTSPLLPFISMHGLADERHAG